MIEILDSTVSEKYIHINFKENDIEFGIKTGDNIEFDLVESQGVRTI